MTKLSRRGFLGGLLAAPVVDAAVAKAEPPRPVMPPLRWPKLPDNGHVSMRGQDFTVFFRKGEAVTVFDNGVMYVDKVTIAGKDKI